MKDVYLLVGEPQGETNPIMFLVAGDEAEARELFGIHVSKRLQIAEEAVGVQFVMAVPREAIQAAGWAQLMPDDVLDVEVKR